MRCRSACLPLDDPCGLRLSVRREGLKCPDHASRSRKINLEKVQASLDKVCPKCGGLISPAEVRRIDFERIECPVCGEQLAPRGAEM